MGRGGIANIGSPHVKATARKDEIEIPDVALRPSKDDQEYHTGRGGEGNVHKVAKSGIEHPQGLADKLKYMMFKKKASA